jgi:NADH-quinone oxidoreductase subunit D
MIIAVGDVATAPTGAVDLALRLGPHHPSSHGLIRLRVGLDGDRIASAEPLIGHVHRGAEKLFEARDYRQILGLANRHDWHGAFASEVGVALAVEQLIGMSVPERATWLRTTMYELNRMLSHLAFVIPVAYPDPHLASASPATQARDGIQAAMEQATGGRLHFMANQVGGLKADVDPAWATNVKQAIDLAGQALPHLQSVLFNRLGPQLTGLGVLSASTVADFGVSGVAAHAAGVDLDLRRSTPYLAYSELSSVLTPVLRSDGDAFARFECLFEHLTLSIALIDACLPRLGELNGAPVNVKLPKVLRAPEGSTYVSTEGPLGTSGYYLVSRGKAMPWRLKMRTASFNNTQALSQIIPGCKIDDLVPLLQSMVYVIGDIDK